MIDDSSTMPAPIDTGRGRISTLDQLAAIPEEEIWLQKQKSPRTRRAYRLDVQHFMGTLSITLPEELRQADHKAAIAWERYTREVEHARPVASFNTSGNYPAACRSKARLRI